MCTTAFEANDNLASQFWNEYLYEYIKSRKFASEVIKIYIVTARYLTDRNTKEEQEIYHNKIIFRPEDKYIEDQRKEKNYRYE